MKFPGRNLNHGNFLLLIQITFSSPDLNSPDLEDVLEDEKLV